MCDVCFEYGVITVSINKHKKEIECCFKCIVS